MLAKLIRTATELTLTLPPRRNLWAGIAIGYGLFLVVSGANTNLRELSAKEDAIAGLLVAGFLFALAAVFFAEDRIRVTQQELHSEWRLFGLRWGRRWPLEQIKDLRFDNEENNLVLQLRGHLLLSTVVTNIDEETVSMLLREMRVGLESGGD